MLQCEIEKGLAGEACRHTREASGKGEKPPAARQLEDRVRARTLGVRVAVVSEAHKYVTASQPQPGTTYTIERTPVGWVCTCEGYLNTNCCKHLGAVERRAAREGWAFGTIAPPSRVERYFPLDAPTPIEHQAHKAAAMADLYGVAD